MKSKLKKKQKVNYIFIIYLKKKTQANLDVIKFNLYQKSKKLLSQY